MNIKCSNICFKIEDLTEKEVIYNFKTSHYNVSDIALQYHIAVNLCYWRSGLSKIEVYSKQFNERYTLISNFLEENILYTIEELP